MLTLTKCIIQSPQISRLSPATLTEKVHPLISVEVLCYHFPHSCFRICIKFEFLAAWGVLFPDEDSSSLSTPPQQQSFKNSLCTLSSAVHIRYRFIPTSVSLMIDSEKIPQLSTGETLKAASFWKTWDSVGATWAAASSTLGLAWADEKQRNRGNDGHVGDC